MDAPHECPSEGNCDHIETWAGELVATRWTPLYCLRHMCNEDECYCPDTMRCSCG